MSIATLLTTVTLAVGTVAVFKAARKEWHKIKQAVKKQAAGEEPTTLDFALDPQTGRFSMPENRDHSRRAG